MLNYKSKYEKFASIFQVIQNTQNLVIPRCCFVEENKEMYKDLKRTCTAVVLLIKPFVATVVCLRSLLGNLRKPRRQRQRERRQTKGLISRTIAVHVRYKSLYI